MERKTTGISGILVVCLCMASVALAEEKTWENQAELSYVDTGGNTDVTTVAAKNKLTAHFSEKLKATWVAGALAGQSDGERSSERYYTELRGDRLLSKRLYTALIAGWSKDQFAGIDSRYYIGPALGYKVLTGPRHLLQAEAGLDYVTEEYTDDTDNDFWRGRAFAEYEYAFTEKNRFSQSVEYLYDFDDSDNYNINSVTSLSSALNDILSLKATYEVRFDNEPVPETLDDTDTTFTVALVIDF